jgi:hypothetical protein
LLRLFGVPTDALVFAEVLATELRLVVVLPVVLPVALLAVDFLAAAFRIFFVAAFRARLLLTARLPATCFLTTFLAAAPFLETAGSCFLPLFGPRPFA